MANKYYSELTKRYSQLEIKLLQGNFGCNIHLPNKAILTVYFKKEIYCNNKQNVWRNFKGFKELFLIIDELLLPKQNNATMTILDSNTGTLACIEHIKTKHERFTKEFPKDHKTAVMLQTIIQELTQYA
jgi:hypothetical protein